MIEDFLTDIRYGFRMLRKRPALTAVAIITLTLGIGANTAIFSVVDAVILRPLPFPGSNRIVTVWESSLQIAQPKMSACYRDFEEWRRTNHTFEKLAAYTLFAPGSHTLTGAGDPQNVVVIPTTVDFFSLLGTPAELGRPFTADDLNSGPAVVLAHGFWKTTFGGSADIVGKMIVLDGAGLMVLGVMPEQFPVYPKQAHMWTLLRPTDPIVNPNKQHMISVVGRLKAGVSMSEAQRDLAMIRTAVNKDDPDNISDVGVIVNSLQEEYTWLAGRNLRSALLLLMAAVGLVLLIACVNVANLMLARSTERRKEMAVRAALGSGRWRLIQQLLTENIILYFFGAVFGVSVATAMIRYFIAHPPIDLPPAGIVALDIRVIAFTTALTTITGLLFGVVPAWSVSRLDLNEALKSGRTSGTGGLSGKRLRGLLVVLEVALAMTLLIGSGLIIRSVIGWQNVPWGFNPRNVCMAFLSFPKNKVVSEGEQARFYKQVVDRISTEPGVQHASLGTNIPAFGGAGVSVMTEGSSKPVRENTYINQDFVSSDFFDTLQIPVLAGRRFTGADVEGAEPVVIINHALANECFPDENPLDKRIRVSDSDDFSNSPSLTVVGVVGDVRSQGIFNEMDVEKLPGVYRPFEQARQARMLMFVRYSGDPATLSAVIREHARALDKDVPVVMDKPMTEYTKDIESQPRLRAIVIGAFAGLSLLLSAIGLYGVLSQSVLQRTNEIGIRIALGARGSHVLSMILRQGLALTLVGVLAGLGGALALTRVLSSMLYGIEPTDPWTFAILPLVLLGVALLACYIPGRRATRINPLDAIRYE